LPSTIGHGSDLPPELRSVRVTRVGDTDFLVDEQVDRSFMEENEK
jgi:hypothetical protein